MFDEKVLDAFNIYILLRTLADSNERIRNDISKEDIEPEPGLASYNHTLDFF